MALRGISGVREGIMHGQGSSVFEFQSKQVALL